MPRSYRYLHYDVFTDRLFGGNQLAVVLDGRGLSTSTMQAVAREMNFSETTFLLPPEQRGTDFRLRIFTPGAELPMAGHPTIGSAFALARAGIVEPRRKTFVFGLGIGPTPIALKWQGRDLRFAWMKQRRPLFSKPLANPGAVARALGLQETAVTRTALPVQVVSTGLPYLMVPLATRRDVDTAVNSPSAIEALVRSAPGKASGVFLFTRERGRDNATAYSRMFAPGLGVPEDPATGSAGGPLGCYLVRHRIVSVARAGRILNLQGVKMGRPSYIHVAIGVRNSRIAEVLVGGAAVLAGEGTLYI
jgi:trans-2,3-dihydro-3-hydroxyanthranilate isomerase